jgi:F-type H+-transporting ATPase subunit gamma
MATLRDIKKRIVSVRSTQKITKAMKMVAAAKFARAQALLLGSRPYVEKLKNLIDTIVTRHPDEILHPLLTQRDDIKQAVVFVMTSNRGLCGSFNTNIIRAAEQFLNELASKNIAYELRTIGKKASVTLRNHGFVIKAMHNDWAEALTFADTSSTTHGIMSRFLSGEIDAFYNISSHFFSAMSHKPVVDRLLPINLDMVTPHHCIDFIYEPSCTAILNALLPRYVATQLLTAHLESRTSELGARMTAMESATTNAATMIQTLTLSYNRARQTSITKELMDIVNGAEALR